MSNMARDVKARFSSKVEYRALTHSHTMTPSDAPGKTLWEKEKLLFTSNFPFSHSVFYLFG